MTRAVIRTGGRGLTPVEHPADRHGDGFADPQPAVTFADELEHLPFDELLRVANDASSQRVAAALAAHPLELTLHDFAALLSRAAGERLPEARHLLRDGFRSILLLTGEHERLTGVEFLEDRIRLLANEVPQLAIEVQVWS